MKSRLILTKTAIADARGVCFEYAPRHIIRERNSWATSYFAHHKFGTGSGRYSDDAQMSLAVAETLLEHGAGATAHDFAESFVRAFKREATPREGYAGGFHQFLLTVETGDDFLARIHPVSDKSGGAMRAGPCGLFGDVATVLALASRQAAVTHDTTGGRAAAQAAALMVHYLLHRLGPRAGLPAFLDLHVPGHDWSRPHRGEVGPKGLDSVRAALTALVATRSFADLLIECVAYGGDVDTVAAIAAAAGACDTDRDQSIPEGLWRGLENGAYGRDHLVAIDARLDDLAKAQGARPIV